MSGMRWEEHEALCRAGGYDPHADGQANGNRPIFDSDDLAFWMPQNWPGGRAPCRHEWRYRTLRDGSTRLHLGVTLWVRLSPDHEVELWSASSSGIGQQGFAGPLARAETAARELEAKRDEAMREYAVLAEAERLGVVA